MRVYLRSGSELTGEEVGGVILTTTDGDELELVEAADGLRLYAVGPGAPELSVRPRAGNALTLRVER